MLHRSSGRNLKLQGVRCEHCGTPQFPPARVCAQCHTKDEMTPYRFADKDASLFTYSYDQISRTKDPPLIIGLVDFAGGGRIRIMIADGDIDKLERGMPLEMSFRLMYMDVGEGIQNYYWKATPIRVR
jgi:hydroxymethylglutaryl-CoA synthase